jgi:diguanylate cyclase (GGDEF)-like protein
LNKFKLLIIEDNHNNVKALKEITSTIDKCMTFFAFNGNDALKILMEEKINLIFLDLGLPDIPGYDLLKLIKRRKRTSMIPVVITTGMYMKEENKKKGFEIGASDYILKPYTKEEIEIKLLQYMNYYKRIQDLIDETMEKNIRLERQNRSLTKAYKKIEHLITHDGLTNLNNRYYFEKYILENDLDLEMPLSIVMMDMNNLKLINDAYGHAKGDEVILEAVEYLQDLKEVHDTLIRWGGDEFMLIMPKTDSEKAQEYVSSIINKKFEINDMTNVLNLSAGTHTLDKVDNSLLNAIKIAEDRMYRNKLMNASSYRSSVIESLKKTLFEKDFETEKHTERVAEITLEMAKGMNMTIAEKDEVYLLATLHDIGKIGIPDSILLKPERLTENEWKLIRKHPEVGCNICKTIPELSGISEYILCHHEWWNGRGYPRGLKGNQIPILARILTIADAYDVMTTGRPYKVAMTHDEAKEELKRCAGTQFDPELVETFIKCCS